MVRTEPSLCSKETVHFQKYLLQIKRPIPKDYYTDRVSKNGLLNWFTIHSSKFVIYFFHNLLNVSLQSRDTATKRLIFRDLEPAKFETGPDEIASERGRSTSNEQLESESQLHFPERRKFPLAALSVLQFLIWIHYLFALYALNDPSNKKYAITCSKHIQIHQTLVQILNAPVSLTSSTRPPDGGQLDARLAACLTHLEVYIFERYDKFYVWNTSVSFLSSPIYEDFLVVEQNKVLQMFSEETSIFCHTIGTVIISCIILGFLLDRSKPYDVAAMVFIYDPRYSAYYIKCRLQYYLSIVRASYENFWTIHRLDFSNSLSGCILVSQLCNQQTGGKYAGQPGRPSEAFALARTLPALPNSANRTPGAEQFDDYIPSARGQAWRKVLMISIPIYLMISSLVASCALSILYIFVADDNQHTIELNRELRQFIFNGTEPDGFDEVVARHCAPKTEQKHETVYGSRRQLANFVRWKIIEFLSDALRSLSPDLSRLQQEPIEWSRKLPELTHVDSGSVTTTTAAATSYSSDNYDGFNEINDMMLLNKRLVINSIAPVQLLTFVNWVVPFLGATLMGLLVSLYFAIFVSSIADLCFWLFEIRMKLDICKILLKYYDVQARDNERERERDSQDQLDDDCMSVSLHKIGDLISKFRTLESALIREGNDKGLRGVGVGGQVQRIRNSCTCLSQNRRASRARLGPMGSGAHEELEVRAETRAPGDACLAGQQLERESYQSDCNVGASGVIDYILSSRSKRSRMCESYANQLIRKDANQLNGQCCLHESRRASDCFLLSTYLDFRLFLDQIDTCSFSVNFILSYTVLQALNMLAASQFTDMLRSQIGFTMLGYVIANLTLIGSSFFQSQCTKIISPIYSILAASLRGDENTKHLSCLWQRALVDLASSRSKFSFRVYSVNISYATALQFNLGVTSLYILTIDKMRYKT